MFLHTNRILFATLALLVGLTASACSKKKGEPQTDVPSAQTTTPGNNHDHMMDPAMKDHDHMMDPAMKDHDRRMDPAMKDHDHPMDPAMKDHDHPMGTGNEGDADKHDREHP